MENYDEFKRRMQAESNVFLTDICGASNGKRIYSVLCKKLPGMENINKVIKRFNNEEWFIKLDGGVRQKNVHLFAQYRMPETDDLIERIRYCDIPEEDKYMHILNASGINTVHQQILLIGDALRRAGAQRVMLYLPFIPYLRQDKKDDGRVPISAKVIFDQYTGTLEDELAYIATMTLHSDQSQGFTNKKVDQIFPSSLFAAHVMKMFANPEDMVVLSPDAGGATRAQYLANLIGTDLAIMQKKRPEHGVAIPNKLIGDVSGRHVIIYDDLIDSGGSIVKLPEILIKAGAKEPIYAIATHGVASTRISDGKLVFAEDTLRNSGIKVIWTNSIPRSDDYIRRNADWLTMLSINPYFTGVIERQIRGKSVSESISELEKKAKDGTFDLDRFSID